MPSLGAGMDQGKLLEWMVHPGDEVHRGDIVAVVETDKAAIEVEVFEDGVVQDLVVDEGTKVPVGAVLAHLAAAGAQAPVQETPPPAAAAASRVAVPTPAPAPPPPPARLPRAAPAAGARGPGAVRSSPWARRLAQDRGVDLEAVTGTGPGRAVVARDLPGRDLPSTAPVEEVDREAGMRQAIARAMATSKREIPHYYLGHHVDLEDSLQWLEARNADRPPTARVLPAVLVLRATALACRQFPDLNAFWTEGAHRPAPAVHLGVAIALRGGGLVAPAIHDADQRSLEDLMAALTDLVSRARAGRLRGSEVSDPTITVTNLGDRGVESVYGIIYPPQVALVGAGRITPRPWPVDGSVAVRRVVHLTLAADHRASDGHRGALFLDAIARRLQEPETL
jgi:pyruvate dehydrogenase E2 component (dihydrolipoamide acetyltransferase)